MRTIHVMIAAALLAPTGLATIPSAAAGQERRLNDEQVRALLDRIEQDADRFKDSLEDGIDKSPMNGTWEEDEIDRYVSDFEGATDRLEERFRDGHAANELVREVLRRGAVIDQFVTERAVGPIAQRDWTALRARLEDLALAYGVRWDWTLGRPAVTAPARRLNDDELERLVKSIEENTDRFRDSLDDAIDDGPADGTRAEREAEALMRAFDEATDRLRDRFDSDEQLFRTVGRVVRDAERVDDFVRRYRLTPDARASWERVRAQVRELATSYGLDTW